MQNCGPKKQHDVKRLPQQTKATEKKMTLGYSNAKQ